MPLRRVCVALLLFVSCRLVAQETKPFPMDWRNTAGQHADVSFLLEAPAGKDGFITAKDGHLVKPNGERFRIWGVNLTGAATKPSRDDAPLVAAYLARFGVNCVRFHFLDLPARGGLIAANRDDTRALDPEQLERLDFFIAELKKRGIYTDLNLNVGRRYKAGDGVADYELLGFAKGLTYFDDRLLELQREYASQLLTHYNPYTKSEYRNEPAVAVIELVNENSIVESWFSNRLLGKNVTKNPGTWTDIPESYEKQLTEKYNAWLAKRLPAGELKKLRAMAGVAADAPVPRLRREQFADAPAFRFHTEAGFYMELENDYFQMMRKLIKEELGARPLVAATSDHNHGASGYPLLSSASRLDIVDGHTYWQHPNYKDDPVTKRRIGYILNTPMVNDPLNSTVAELSRSAVAGKPYTVSEVNHPFPAEHACEGIPILAAYAALHDWDGIFWYTFGHVEPSGWEAQIPGHFDIRPDPVKMPQLAAGALLFARPDIRPAAQTIGRSYGAEQVRESIRLPRTERPYFTPGFPVRAALEHATRILGFDGPATKLPEAPGGEADRIVSDTGELAWQGFTAKQGVVTMETKRSQSLIGFCNSNRPQLSNLAAEIQNRFCALTLQSMSALPLAEAPKMLLTATARTGNTAMKWDEKHASLVSWGGPPTWIEPVVGTVVLRKLKGAKRVEAVALDGAAQPIGKPVAARQTMRGWEIPIGDPATTWYSITVAR